MATAKDYERQAEEAEALAATSRHQSFRVAFQKLAQDYRELARQQRTLFDEEAAKH